MDDSRVTGPKGATSTPTTDARPLNIFLAVNRAVPGYQLAERTPMPDERIGPEMQTELSCLSSLKSITQSSTSYRFVYAAKLPIWSIIIYKFSSGDI